MNILLNMKKNQEDFIKMKNLIKTAVMCTAATLTAISCANALAADTVVEVSSIANDIPEIVSFPKNEKPFEIDNTLYVPCRVIADAMGMNTEWNQEQLTATLVINSNASSTKPIERYAYEISEGIEEADAVLVPTDVTVDLKAGSQYALVRYNFTDSEGTTQSYGKTVSLDGKVRILDGGTLAFPLRSVVETLGLQLDWSQESRTATVDIPEVAKIPDNLGILAESTVIDETASNVAAASDTQSNMVYLGTFRISHYAPGTLCNGVWGNATAWGGDITPGRTIAVDKNVIAPLSWVYIDGYGYRCAEDCGGAIVGNKIDVAVATYEEAMKLGIVYKDVYLCTE